MNGESTNMMLQYFSPIGYVSVVLWLLVPVLWVLHVKIRPRKWLCHLALLVAVAAFALAKINSTGYVNRIQLDPSKQVAQWQAKQDAKLKKAEESRSEDVADVRYAEDAAGDYLDMAGMDDSDLKYMEALNDDSAPAWKKEKKERSGSSKKDDNSLDALIGAKQQTEGVEGSGLEKVAEKDPVLMPEKDMMLANRLDGLNLKIIRILIVLGALYVFSDYLHRVNSYREAYLPLPIPSAWTNGMLPPKPIMSLPAKPRRSTTAELEWITRRGDCFVYMTDKPGNADKVPASIPSLLGKFRKTDVIKVDSSVSDKFVFEALWYGRSSFVVDSGDRAIQMLGEFVGYLLERKACRARVRQTFHIVWDMTVPLDEEWQKDFAKLAKATGIALVICPA